MVTYKWMMPARRWWRPPYGSWNWPCEYITGWWYQTRRLLISGLCVFADQAPPRFASAPSALLQGW